MTTTFKPGQFCWVDLSTSDLGAAIEWYGQLFGWSTKPAPADARYRFFTKDDQIVGGLGEIPAEMKGKMPSAWNNYVSVDSVESVAARAKELGGDVAVPPMSVGDNGSFCFVRDPGGAMLGAWQAGDLPGAERVNDPGAFCWNELMTRDVEGAKKFYGGLLGWDIELDADAGGYILIKSHGRENGGLMPMSGPEWGDMPPHWMPYFTVVEENVAGANARVREIGGKVLVERIEIPNVGVASVVQDPQGATFSLFGRS